MPWNAPRNPDRPSLCASFAVSDAAADECEANDDSRRAPPIPRPHRKSADAHQKQSQTYRLPLNHDLIDIRLSASIGALALGLDLRAAVLASRCGLRFVFNRRPIASSTCRRNMSTAGPRSTIPNFASFPFLIDPSSFIPTHHHPYLPPGHHPSIIGRRSRPPSSPCTTPPPPRAHPAPRGGGGCCHAPYPATTADARAEAGRVGAAVEVM